MNPFLYQPIFTGMAVALAVIMAFRRVSSPDNTIQLSGSSPVIPFLLCSALMLWMGFRPVSAAFGDTVNYALEYAILDGRFVSMNWSQEWIWSLLMNGCKAVGLSVNVFFAIISAGYVMSAFWAIRRFMPTDPMLGVVFLLNSLMFFPFGVNGLRNGLACHLVLLGISFLLEDKWVPGTVVFLIAFGIHRSTLLPIVAILFALFLIRNVRVVILFWLSSILISLVAGDAVSGLFSSLGFDDRMTQYATMSSNSEFSSSGFRWDFLLYSAAPVIMAWFVCIKKGLQDNWYNVICTAYCLCNAFWIIVIRSAFSNRFAYLSWFLYPLVIAYPLVNMPIQENQDQLTGWILLAYSGFSAFMWFIFW